MTEFFKIPEDDPDLEAFERLIADFHPWYRRFKRKSENRPSYKHRDFSQKAFQYGPYPGSDDPYCTFAFSLFNDPHVDNYLLDCQHFLEKPYGRKKEQGVEKVKNAFEQLAQDKETKLIKDLSELAGRCCYVWFGMVGQFILEGKRHIDADLQQWIINECQLIGEQLWELSKSDELEHGELSTLDTHGRYGVLAKLLLQDYMNSRESHLLGYLKYWVRVRLKQKKTREFAIKSRSYVTKEFALTLPRYIDVVLAHSLVNKLSMRAETPPSPTDFIYKEISKNKFAKSKDLRSQYRWLFIKAWLYAYLNRYDLTLSQAADDIARDDDFFYMSDMQQLGEQDSELTDEEIVNARFLDLKNNFSAWNNNKQEKGYIHSQILASSKDQA